MFDKITAHNVNTQHMLNNLIEMGADDEFNYISTIEDELDVLGLFSTSKYREIMADIYRRNSIAAVRNTHSLGSQTRPHVGTLNDIARSFERVPPTDFDAGILKVTESDWIELDMIDVNSGSQLYKIIYNTLTHWSSSRPLNSAHDHNSKVMFGVDVKVPTRGRLSNRLAKGFNINIVPNVVNTACEIPHYFVPLLNKDFIGGQPLDTATVAKYNGKIYLKFRYYHAMAKSLGETGKDINSLLSPKAAGEMADIHSADAFKRIDCQGRDPGTRILDEMLGAFKADKSEKDVRLDFANREKYEAALAYVLRSIVSPGGRAHTRIEKDFIDILDLLLNNRGVIGELMFGKEEDIDNIQTFKFIPSRLKEIKDFLSKSDYLKPEILCHVPYPKLHMDKVKEAFNQIHRNQWEAKRVSLGISTGSGSESSVVEDDKPSTSRPRPVLRETSFQSHPQSDTRYHLITTNFGAAGEVMEMHYYVNASESEASKLNRNYWLTEDEAIERLENIRDKTYGEYRNGRAGKYFNGHDSNGSTFSSTGNLSIDLQDAKGLSLAEATSSKASMLIDIYEEHFGEDMIIIQTDQKTYYCRTINMTGVSNSHNLITFEDIVSVIPDGVRCEFGKRTIYGLHNDPEELTPKQLFRKMLELKR